MGLNVLTERWSRNLPNSNSNIFQGLEYTVKQLKLHIIGNIDAVMTVFVISCVFGCRCEVCFVK